MKREWKGALLAFVIFSSIVFALAPYAVLHFPTIYFAGVGDGLKTYYAYLYHLRYDTSYMMFGGMNYPFGEHIMFTDNQPLLVTISRLLSLPPNSFLMNGLILLCVTTTAPVMYLLLRRFEVPRVLAVAAAVCISLLAPQIMRLSGHEGLSHPVFVPMVWLLLLTFFDHFAGQASDAAARKQSIGRSFVIALWISAFGGIHPYYFFIGSIFVISFWFSEFCFKRTKPGLNAAIQIILPAVVFISWSHLTDPIKDRVIPMTSLYYRAHFESVFFPYESALFRPLFDRVLSLHRELPGEAYVYVGVCGFMALVAMINALVRRLIKKQSHPFRVSEDLAMRVSFFAAVLCLLYALGYPWIWMGVDTFRKAGPLAQFRSFARFAWPFYYVFSVYAFYLFARMTAKMSKPVRFAILFVLCALEFTEGFSHARNSLIQVNNNAQNANFEINPELKGVLTEAHFAPEHYQAIMPLPFYQSGAEQAIPDKIRERELERSFADSVDISLQTGLPIMAQALSRSSYEQSREMFAIFANDYKKPTLPNDKPILIVQGPEPKLDMEMAVAAKAKLLAKSANYSVYEIAPRDL